VLPDALVALRTQHPQVQVRVVAGLSAELASLVDRGEADAACVSEPGWAAAGADLAESARAHAGDRAAGCGRYR
jgi:DNA-binding transcriptional LysR family regulator